MFLPRLGFIIFVIIIIIICHSTIADGSGVVDLTVLFSLSREI